MGRRLDYKKRRLEETPKEGVAESWITSYADMISLLFALFALMYGMSKVNEGKFRSVAEALSRSLSTGGLNASYVRQGRENKDVGLDDSPISPSLMIEPLPHTERGRGNEDSAALEELQDEIVQALDSQGVRDKVSMRLEERGLVVGMMTDKLIFSLGEADLTEPARKILSAIAPVLKKCNNSLRIEGHTCNLPVSGRFRNNWELSTMRATNVANYLITVQRISPERISILGYGEYHPRYPNTSEMNRAKNRRVDIVIVKISTTTDFEEENDEQVMESGTKNPGKTISHEPRQAKRAEPESTGNGKTEPVTIDPEDIRTMTNGYVKGITGINPDQTRRKESLLEGGGVKIIMPGETEE